MFFHQTTLLLVIDLKYNTKVTSLFPTLEPPATLSQLRESPNLQVVSRLQKGRYTVSQLLRWLSHTSWLKTVFNFVLGISKNMAVIQKNAKSFFCSFPDGYFKCFMEISKHSGSDTPLPKISMLLQTAVELPASAVRKTLILVDFTHWSQKN